MRSHAIRLQLEQSLRGKGPSPFRSIPPGVSPETVPTGIYALDRLTGGLPRGRITEILGPVSSGRTSLMLSALAEITGRDECCGVIDPKGAFDPVSAARSGVDLGRLLWVRTGGHIESALKTTDLLLQGGGFGLIGVDLSELPPSAVERVPLSSWIRLQRAVEHTPTILMFLSSAPRVQTTASLVLELRLERTTWSPRLLHGLHPSVEIVRSKHSITESPGGGAHFELQPAENGYAFSNES